MGRKSVPKKQRPNEKRQRYEHAVGLITLKVTPTDDEGRPIGPRRYYEVRDTPDFGAAITALLKES